MFGRFSCAWESEGLISVNSAVVTTPAAKATIALA